jgi:glycosyltransferase involved in cell wall biosynthesis
MKIALLGPLPAASVLPLEVIRPRNRSGEHPAPWIVALLPALARASGFKLRVILVQRAILRHTLVEREGVEYEGIPTLALERWFRPSRFWSKTPQARAAIRRFQPDVVHAFGLETGLANVALRCGFPVSCFIQGIAECFTQFGTEFSPRQRRLMLAAELDAVRRIRWLVAETCFARDWALAKHPAAHVALIPHPLRSVFLEEAAPRFERKVLSVGALSDYKGMDTIVRAFAKVPDAQARLTLVGDGALRGQLVALAASLGIAARVEFTGVLDRAGVIRELNSAGVFVLGSRMDTSPNVLTEAHAIGLPVIGTRAGGIPEMIDEGKDGFVVPVDDADAMADRMQRLLADPALARRLGAAGRAKVKEWNAPAAVAAAHVEFFNRVQADLDLPQASVPACR